MRTIVNARRPSGFTLIELSMVILIIGILMAFVLATSFAATESARVRATQALITKLSVGLEERLEAVLATSVSPNGAHRFLASIQPPPPYTTGVGGNLPWGVYKETDQRAQVIARLDQIRAEFPDVFYIDPAVIAGGSKQPYPVRFGGLPYPDFTAQNAGFRNYQLPLGDGNWNPALDYIPENFNQANVALTVGPGAGSPGSLGTGINGASYAAAASLYKLVGYNPKGYDGLDNNGDGFVDDHLEGTSGPNDNSGSDVEANKRIDNFLVNHRHKTARAEMLYALLVEGLGPLGSVFHSEDFRDSEVKDTDGDGVPEFVDGWGEPLQFFMWPYYYQSDIQKGHLPYGGFEVRQQNPLDPNNQLTAMAWWSNNSGASPVQMSTKCLAVQNYFGPLYDDFWVPGPVPNPAAWDRSGSSGRRAFRTKFLILSSGSDRLPGVPLMSDNDVRNPSTSAYQLAQYVRGTITSGQNGVTAAVIPGEGWAIKIDPYNLNSLPVWARSNPDYTGMSLDVDYSLDDISNHDIQSKSGGFQ